MFGQTGAVGVIRGFVAGLFWGVVVAGAGLAVLSQMTPPPGSVALAPTAEDPLLAPAAGQSPAATAPDAAQDPAPDAAADRAADTAPAPAEPRATAPVQTAPAPAPVVAQPTPVAPLPSVPPLPAAPAARTDAPLVTASPGAAPAPQAPADPISTPTPAAEPLEPLRKSFENPENRPTFAILLVDTGAPGLDRARLARLPFPVTFVLDPLAEDAARAAAIYHDAGQEVILRATGLPEGAKAQDVEQTFETLFQAIPQAEAVIDLNTGGFQDRAALASLVVPVIKAAGRGLVTFDRGLNVAEQVARRDSVPSAVVFRSLDADGESQPMIRRYLDRAAFKAAQDGRVVVIGTTADDTVAALLAWSVEGRAGSVALAPLSAVLSKP